jgi:lysozyme family protein
MADFLTAYRITLKHEGEYANFKDDTGGETYKGVSRNNFPKWAGWKTIDEIKSRVGKTAIAINREAAKDETLQKQIHAFYKTQFWDSLSLDHVKDQKIANELFDTGVNMGIGIAGLFLQQTLNALNRKGTDYTNLTEDARIGQNTVKVLNEHKQPENILKLLNCLQGARYLNITRANESQEIFMKSWLSRVTI